MAFQKAQRKRAFIKLAVTGPSGSGKTYGALMIAFGMAKGGKVAVIDTENHSAELYSDLGDYDVCPIDAPFHSKKYLEAINDAVQGGYDVLVIDSLTHEWAGEGGILFRKEQTDDRGGNSFTNWAKFTPEHEAFKAAINNAPIHIVATMRSKQDYVLDQKGTPKKVGLAPIQRDGAEYEYSTVFDVALNHEAAVSKDRTGLFDGIIGRITKATGETIATWLESGAEPAPVENDMSKRLTALNESADTAYAAAIAPIPSAATPDPIQVAAPGLTPPGEQPTFKSVDGNGKPSQTTASRADLNKGLHGACASKGFMKHEDVSLIACMRYNSVNKAKPGFTPVSSLTEIPDSAFQPIIAWLESPTLAANSIAKALKQHKDAALVAA